MTKFRPTGFLLAAATLSVSATLGATAGYLHNRQASPDPAPVVSTRTAPPSPSFTRTPAKPSPRPATATPKTEDNGFDHDQTNRDPRIISKPHDPSHPKKVTRLHPNPKAKVTDSTSNTRLAPQSDEPVNPDPSTSDPAGENIAKNQDPIPVTDPNQQPAKPEAQETTPPPPPVLR